MKKKLAGLGGGICYGIYQKIDKKVLSCLPDFGC